MGKINLTPSVRLRMTVQHEMTLDPDGVIFNDDLYNKYLRMHSECLRRQEALIRNTVLVDAALALLLYGKNVTIPGTSLGIQDIPAAVEVFTILSAFSFLMLSISFLNAQCYMAIIEQFNVKKARPYEVDPEFLTAADTHSELYLKIFRSKLNIYGIDFFEAGKGYRYFYTTMIVALLLAFLGMLSLHFVVVFSATWAVMTEFFVSKLLAVTVFLMSTVGILINIFIGFSFELTGVEDPT